MGGCFSPSLARSPGFGGALGNPRQPWVGFAVRGTLSAVCGKQPQGQGCDWMGYGAVSPVLILLFGFLFLG